VRHPGADPPALHRLANDPQRDEEPVHAFETLLDWLLDGLAQEV
jgi:hypothetical protein